MPKRIRVILDRCKREKFWTFIKSTPSLSSNNLLIFSSHAPKASGELIGWDWRQCLSVRASTLSNMNISDTSWPIKIKFHLEHHWDEGLTSFGF